MQIRRFREDDKELYLKLAEDFYHSPAVLHPIPHEYLERTFNEMIRSNVYVDGFLLMSDEGETVGYALVSKTFTQEAGGLTLWVEELSVLPSYRGQGAGSKVLAHLESEYPEWARFRLEVEPDNVRAVKLYERFGYEEIPYFQMGKDAQ
ncbi:MAG: GNAT family N-acetyltransferase [Clostridia bacterium]